MFPHFIRQAERGGGRGLSCSEGTSGSKVSKDRQRQDEVLERLQGTSCHHGSSVCDECDRGNIVSFCQRKLSWSLSEAMLMFLSKFTIFRLLLLFLGHCLDVASSTPAGLGNIINFLFVTSVTAKAEGHEGGEIKFLWKCVRINLKNN